MEINYDYLQTGTAIGFRACRELCSNYLSANMFGDKFELIIIKNKTDKKKQS